VPGCAEDFIPQNQPPTKRAEGGLEKVPDASELGAQAITAAVVEKPPGGKS
jgi:hypothetical protein